MPDLNLLVFLEPRSRGDEMPDLTFLSSWTQEVEVDEMPDLTFLSSWNSRSRGARDAGSRLLVFLDNIEVELTRCRISPSCLLGPIEIEVHARVPKKFVATCNQESHNHLYMFT